MNTEGNAWVGLHTRTCIQIDFVMPGRGSSIDELFSFSTGARGVVPMTLVLKSCLSVYACMNEKTWSLFGLSQLALMLADAIVRPGDGFHAKEQNADELATFAMCFTPMRCSQDSVILNRPNSFHWCMCPPSKWQRIPEQVHFFTGMRSLFSEKGEKYTCY